MQEVNPKLVVFDQVATALVKKNDREYVRKSVIPTLGLKLTGKRCEGGGARGRCR